MSRRPAHGKAAALALALTVAVCSQALSQARETASDRTGEGGAVVVTAPRSRRLHVPTACVWRELPTAERDGLADRAERLLRAGSRGRSTPLDELVSVGVVAKALQACSADSRESAAPTARRALGAYAIERAALGRLAPARVDEAKLSTAWETLSPTERASLTEHLGERVSGRGRGDDEASAKIILDLLVKVRGLAAVNPFAYRSGGANHAIVGYYAARGAREGLETAF
jgi:hypothetical protein